jgi:hypothetical protein
MTTKISISLPDDIAERLSHQPNVSAYVAEALRHRMRMDRTRELLASSGYQLTDVDVAEGRKILDAAAQQMTPDLAAQADTLLARDRPHR